MAVTPAEAGVDAKLMYEIVRDVAFLAFFAWSVINARQRANRSEIEGLRKDHGERLDRHSEKLTTLDERLKAMPKHDDLENIHERINKVITNVSTVDSKVSGIQATVEAIKSAVALLNRHHIAGEGK